MLVPSGVEVLDHKLAVVGGHLAVVLPGDGLGGLLGALLEHFGFLPENGRLGHVLGGCSCGS